MSINEMMDEFMDTYKVDRTGITAKDCDGAYKLTADELDEFHDEFDGLDDKDINAANVAKEMADIIYVAGQRMRRMGMDVDAIMAEVHRSNMSKLVAMENKDMELNIARDSYPDAVLERAGDGVCVIRDPNTGKVVKPQCYSPAEITEEMYCGEIQTRG